MADFTDTQSCIDGLWIGDGFHKITHGFNGDANDRILLNIKAAFIDQKAVHHRVEIRIVRHIIDVAIDVIIRPTGLHRHKMGIPVPGFRWFIVHGMGLVFRLPKILGATVFR